MLTYADEAAPKDERVYKQQHLHGAAVGKAPANSGSFLLTLLALLAFLLALLRTQVLTLLALLVQMYK